MVRDRAIDVVAHRMLLRHHQVGGAPVLDTRDGRRGIGRRCHEQRISRQGMSRSTRGSPGNPSTRSPRMLRIISEVPPSIELAKSRSRRSCIEYNHTSFGSGPPAMHEKWVTGTVVSIDHI